MDSVLAGRPFYGAWVWWRYLLAFAISVLSNGGRLSTFMWAWAAFGKGDDWWQGEGVCVWRYEDCDRILRSLQTRRPALAALTCSVPDLFPAKLLIFLPTGGPESEWAAIRSAVHELFLDV